MATKITPTPESIEQMEQALDFCESILSPSMSDHTCAEFPDTDRKCGECLGCARWAAWTWATRALLMARAEAPR